MNPYDKRKESMKMSKVAVIYWSGTGNTEAMAKHVFEGAIDAGASVDLLAADNVSEGMIDAYDGVALGCPSMGAEELEDAVFEPMFNAIASKLIGKKVALFGSYGWGDGEWMRTWEQDCAKAGIALAASSVICNEAPDEEAGDACRVLGRSIS
jgi:flavodoxin short chain